jgi:hypothetical protein
MRVKPTIWTAAAVVSLAVVPVLGASIAEADTTPNSSAPSVSSTATPRLAQSCGRIPRRIQRLERVQARFHADANTKGSIAFLSARIDKARADGKADLARLLSDRLAVRKDIDSQLPDILARLQDAQQVCASSSASPQASS